MFVEQYLSQYSNLFPETKLQGQFSKGKHTDHVIFEQLGKKDKIIILENIFLIFF